MEKISRQFTINEKSVEVLFNWAPDKGKVTCSDNDNKAAQVNIIVHEVKVNDLPIKQNKKIAKQAVSYLKEDMLGYIVSFCAKAKSRYPDAIQP